MPQTATILLVTPVAGITDLATLTADNADTIVTFTIDRTIALGLNVTAGAVLTESVTQAGSQMAAGGVTGGGTDLVSSIACPLWAGTSRLIKASINVTGAVAAVSGTLATS